MLYYCKRCVFWTLGLFECHMSIMTSQITINWDVCSKACSGGDPTKVDPNVTTFAWNASRMSDRANVPPTYGTGFSLALCWLELLVFVTMMTSQRVRWPTWYNIRKLNTEYFTDTIVTMRVAKDVVNADILVNNGGTSISLRCAMPRSVNACISSVIVLPILVSVWMIFDYHRYDFFTNELWYCGWM